MALMLANFYEHEDKEQRQEFYDDVGDKIYRRTYLIPLARADLIPARGDPFPFWPTEGVTVHSLRGPYVIRRAWGRRRADGRQEVIITGKELIPRS